MTPERKGDEREDPDDRVAASVAAYSDHAAEYEVDHASKMNETVVRFAASLPMPSLILDAGCGPGRDLDRFAACGHVPRGVDLNPEFVAMANERAPTTLADLREVGHLFPAGTFDGVWASASLVHLTPVEGADVLRQFARILRPGGKLYVCVKARGETGWLDEPDGRRWYWVWEPDAFAATVAGSGFEIESVVARSFVEVWASRAMT